MKITSSPEANGSDQDTEENPVPPGAPSRTPVKDPSKKEERPLGDPQPPEKKTPRL